MNLFTILQSCLLKTQGLNLLKNVPQLYQAALTQKLLFHGLANIKSTALQRTPPLGTQLLKTTNPVLVPSCGFKVKGQLKRRCKDCYFVMREERLYVICKTHPRHKQMSMKKPDKNTWIMTHATQSPVRPW